MNKAVKKYVSAKCAKCKRTFLLGFNGIGDAGPNQDQYMCDRCAGVVRDVRGYIKKVRGEK